MPHQKIPGLLSAMQAGDVLVAHPTALREHEISIVPGKAHTTAATHREAMEQGAAEAEGLAVDGWATEDQIHVVKIAAHRPTGQ